MDELQPAHRDPQSTRPDDRARPPGGPTLTEQLVFFLGQRKISAALVLLAAVVLLLPFLGRFGLWDPQEIRNLESAREVAESPRLAVPERLARPPLPLIVVALGVRLFGQGELAARLPGLLCGLLCLGAAYLLGPTLLPGARGRRVGALSALALLATPLVFLGSRQVTLHLPGLFGHLLTVLGLAALLRPAPLTSAARIGGGVAATAGLLIGLFSLGAPLGLSAPLLAAGLALWLAAPAQAGRAALLFGVAGLTLIPPARLLLAGFAGPPALHLIAGGGLAALGLVLVLASRRGDRSSGLACLGALLLPLGLGLCPSLPTTVAGYSAWLGGTLRLPANREIFIDSVLKPLGFQLFPVAILLPAALAELLREPATAHADSDETVTTERFARLLPLAWFGVTYLLTTYQSALVNEGVFPAVGALALAAALYLEPRLRGEAAPSPFGGVLAALVLVLMAHDIGQYPEQYGGAHFGEALRWPGPLLLELRVPRGGPITQGQVVTVALVLLTVVTTPLVGFGLALRGAFGRGLLSAGLGMCLLWTVLAGHALVPTISKHVSHRGLYTRYKALGGGELALYSLPRTGSRFYEQGATEVSSIGALFDFLGKYPGDPPPKRVFAMVGAQELAPIDQFARQGKRKYYVVDDSNAQSLLLSNLLGPGEFDLNPLRRLILDKDHPPTPKASVKVRFEDRIELVGYDLPAEITRGQDLTLRLYFKVLQPVGGTYKVFVHLDGAGARINGDHVPLGGKFPTSYWVQDTYIIDEYTITTSRMGQSAGVYQLYMGLWPGGDGVRMKVTDGPHDENRVKLGVIRVK